MKALLELLSANSTNPYHALVWAAMGALLSVLIHVSNRDPLQSGSPIKTNWLFFFRDNLVRLFIAAILILAFLTFTKSLLGIELNGFVAFVIGAANDRLAIPLGWATKTLFKKPE